MSIIIKTFTVSCSFLLESRRAKADLLKDKVKLLFSISTKPLAKEICRNYKSDLHMHICVTNIQFHK